MEMDVTHEDESQVTTTVVLTNNSNSTHENTLNAEQDKKSMRLVPHIFRGFKSENMNLPEISHLNTVVQSRGIVKIEPVKDSWKCCFRRRSRREYAGSLTQQSGFDSNSIEQFEGSPSEKSIFVECKLANKAVLKEIDCMLRKNRTGQLTGLLPEVFASAITVGNQLEECLGKARLTILYLTFSAYSSLGSLTPTQVELTKGHSILGSYFWLFTWIIDHLDAEKIDPVRLNRRYLSCVHAFDRVKLKCLEFCRQCDTFVDLVDQSREKVLAIVKRNLSKINTIENSKGKIITTVVLPGDKWQLTPMIKVPPTSGKKGSSFSGEDLSRMNLHSPRRLHLNVLWVEYNLFGKKTAHVPWKSFDVVAFHNKVTLINTAVQTIGLIVSVAESNIQRATELLFNESNSDDMNNLTHSLVVLEEWLKNLIPVKKIEYDHLMEIGRWLLEQVEILTGAAETILMLTQEIRKVVVICSDYNASRPQMDAIDNRQPPPSFWCGSSSVTKTDSASIGTGSPATRHRQGSIFEMPKDMRERIWRFNSSPYVKILQEIAVLTETNAFILQPVTQVFDSDSLTLVASIQDPRDIATAKDFQM